MAEEATRDMRTTEERLVDVEKKLDEVLRKLDAMAPKVQVMEDHVFNVEQIATRVPVVRNLLTKRATANGTYQITGP